MRAVTGFVSKKAQKRRNRKQNIQQNTSNQQNAKTMGKIGQFVSKKAKQRRIRKQHKQQHDQQKDIQPPTNIKNIKNIKKELRKSKDISVNSVKLVIYGYVRTIDINYDVIPHEMLLIINKYLDHNKCLYFVGDNHSGEAGINELSEIKRLQEIHNNKIITHIHNGSGFTFYINNQYEYKSIWGAGFNTDGQLGVGFANNAPVTQYGHPMDTMYYAKLKTLTSIKYFNENKINIKNIYTNASSFTAFYIDTQNNLYATGYNQQYQFGSLDNSSFLNHTPYLITTTLLNKIIIKQIAPSVKFSLLLDISGNVYSTGTKTHSLIDDGINGADGHGSNSGEYKTWTKIKSLETIHIETIAAGQQHSLFLTENGMVYSCGKNVYGELGHGDYKSVNVPTKIQYLHDNNITVIDIKCCRQHSLTLDDKYNVYSFGRNYHGECGLSFTSDSYGKGIKIPQMIDKLQNEKIIEIGCGYDHNYGMTNTNKYYLWGNNKYNQVTLTSINPSVLSSNNYNKSNIIASPYLVNNVISTLSNKKIIHKCFVGNQNTTFVLSDFK